MNELNIEICRSDSPGKCCRYLTEDNGFGKPGCLKLVPVIRSRINEEVEAYLAANDGENPCELPLGDNCPGCIPSGNYLT